MAASHQHEKLRTAIGEITKKNGTISCAVAVHDFDSDFRFAFKGDRVFQAASTIKVAILLADAVFSGDARSLLDFPKRPNAYDDAGHEINWNRRRVRHWPRSQYENVIHHVIAHEPIRIGRKRYRAERMQGWYEVAFREIKTGVRRILNLDELVRLSVQQR